MTFDWSDYLELARKFNSDAPTEAEMRCAISRAYYAAFGLARNFLRDQDGDTSIRDRGNVHDYVRREFEGNPAGNRRKIGINLNRLKVKRQKADYDDEYVPKTQTIAFEMKESISTAQFVIGELKTLPPQKRKTR